MPTIRLGFFLSDISSSFYVNLHTLLSSILNPWLKCKPYFFNPRKRFHMGTLSVYSR
jgi:hypothetical protein